MFSKLFPEFHWQVLGHPRVNHAGHINPCVNRGPVLFLTCYQTQALCHGIRLSEWSEFVKATETGGDTRTVGE